MFVFTDKATPKVYIEENGSRRSVALNSERDIVELKDRASKKRVSSASKQHQLDSNVDTRLAGKRKNRERTPQIAAEMELVAEMKKRLHHDDELLDFVKGFCAGSPQAKATYGESTLASRSGVSGANENDLSSE